MIPTSLVQEDTKVGWQVAKAWLQFFTRQDRAVEAIYRSGVTADRPTKGLWIGMPYFDTTLGHPIWYDGTQWVDATGASV